MLIYNRADYKVIRMSIPESISPLLEPDNKHQIYVYVQTSNINVESSLQAANIHVNNGIQTSARIWS
jgi:hypothetical protein